MIGFVCTDRGRHRRWFIAEVDPDDPMRASRGDRRFTSEEDRNMSSATARGGYDPTRAGTYRLQCTKCGRDARFVRERWVQLVEGLAAQDLRRCDVSYLPD